tara:strand:+ start:105 stop:551 length:447 start_codon:yes stop_codon:yes gene_type:complete
MRLPEQRLYDWLARKLSPVAMLERVENRVKKDTPDLYLSTTHGQALRPRPLQGWIELKVLDAFPVRPATTVRLAHWTNGQRYWALRHRSSGGWTWLVVQVGTEVFVLNASDAAGNDWTQAEWRSNGVRLDKRGCSTDDVLAALSEVVL